MGFKQLCCTGDQTIESWIKGDTSFGFETICLELTKTPHEMEADALREALAGFAGIGTDNAILQRVLCLMPTMDMPRLQQCFKERHPEGKTLEECIQASVSAIFTTGYKDTLFALLSPAKCIAADLHDALQAWYGTDDSKL